MLHDTDEIRIRHMIEAASQAVSFVTNRDRADLDTNAQLRLAPLRALETLGEAASRLSTEVRDANPQIPWRRMIGTRNRLVHAYFDIDLDIVWTTATQSLPKLTPMLAALLPPDDTP